MTRAGFVAVIGATNAGKSTLVNALVGEKVSIVTHKVQTTRFSVRGVAIAGDSQIVLVDTPGIFAPRRRLDRAMVRAAWSALAEADNAIHLVDAKAEWAVREGKASHSDAQTAHDVAAIVAELPSAPRRPILVLNKIDAVPRERLLGLADEFFRAAIYSEVFMVSAMTGDGVDDLKARLASLMPEGPWLYPADQSADLPQRLLASEVTREKVYLRVHEELPYRTDVETTEFEERADGSARIEQTLYVEREGQKGILLGKGGRTLKWIGTAARAELAVLLGRPVHLFLHVKVKAGWSEQRSLYRATGLDFDA